METDESHKTNITTDDFGGFSSTQSSTHFTGFSSNGTLENTPAVDLPNDDFSGGQSTDSDKDATNSPKYDFGDFSSGQCTASFGAFTSSGSKETTGSLAEDKFGDFSNWRLWLRRRWFR